MTKTTSAPQIGTIGTALLNIDDGAFRGLYRMVPVKRGQGFHHAASFNGFQLRVSQKKELWL